jgi:hypothetical protein
MYDDKTLAQCLQVAIVQLTRRPGSALHVKHLPAGGYRLRWECRSGRTVYAQGEMLIDALNKLAQAIHQIP